MYAKMFGFILVKIAVKSNNIYETIIMVNHFGNQLDEYGPSR